MTKKQFYNKLGLSYIESDVQQNNGFTTGIKTIWLILLTIIWLVLCVFSIAFAYGINNKVLNYIYIYSLDLVFGNLIWIFLPYFAFILIVLILENIFKQKTVAWFKRIYKIHWFYAKKMIIKASIYLLLAFILMDNIILYFTNGIELNFESEKVYLLFINGWWKYFKEGFYQTKHMGFVFDTIINLTYLITLSSIVPFLLMFIFFFLAILNLQPYKKIKDKFLSILGLKNKWLSIYKFNETTNNLHSVLKATSEVMIYIDAIFYLARRKKLDLNKNFLALEKEIRLKVSFHEIKHFLEKHKKEQKQHLINLELQSKKTVVEPFFAQQLDNKQMINKNNEDKISFSANVDDFFKLDDKEGEND
ncbi:hypothetical protein GE118_02370 [Mycoplasma sp. NEAQ87857]|uniref:hypothetical protein n=1 Tax=Mycoplasma sp. NEAQ87857 TaxID=2683967 RepID=UPI00131660D2|nr:hypothetical protein [Mycoplasma sp. NEAQ87857]QGZ97639.1 hypothetical protein GE118_02370 [Mycoplasma sp. NEAQ87857]